jgi:hypothetical protein
MLLPAWCSAESQEQAGSILDRWSVPLPSTYDQLHLTRRQPNCSERYCNACFQRSCALKFFAALAVCGAQDGGVLRTSVLEGASAIVYVKC